MKDDTFDSVEGDAPDDSISAEDCFLQGVSRFEEEDFAGAIQHFEQGVELLTEDELEGRWSFSGYLGLCHYKTGDWSRGVTETTVALDAAVGSAPEITIAQLYYQRGMMHLALGDRKKQQNDFADARVYDPQGKLEPPT